MAPNSSYSIIPKKLIYILFFPQKNLTVEGESAASLWVEWLGYMWRVQITSSIWDPSASGDLDYTGQAAWSHFVLF